MAGSELRADLWITEYITPWDLYVHGVTNILAYEKTPYQEMQIVETGAYGKALVLDGKWQSCTGDEFLYHEPLVHPAAIAHGAPERVLILGGGEGATLREVLRWPSVKRAVMIDIDEAVVRACQTHLGEMHQGAFDDPRVELVFGDALQYLDETDEAWDIVISDLSDPIEEGPSFQLFTKEYFAKVQQTLSPSGMFVVQAGPVDPVEMQLHARIYTTLESLFPHVVSYSSYVPTYAAPWGFVLASAQPLDDLLDADRTDARLGDLSQDLKMFDGMAMRGMLSLPKHLRKALQEETQVYTLAEPPKFFGKGIVRDE